MTELNSDLAALMETRTQSEATRRGAAPSDGLPADDAEEPLTASADANECATRINPHKETRYPRDWNREIPPEFDLEGRLNVLKSKRVAGVENNELEKDIQNVRRAIRIDNELRASSGAPQKRREVTLDDEEFLEQAKERLAAVNLD